MDTAEVEVFLVLADELHFGRTAERLYLTQPQVSRLVARLERRVGGALFERTTRRVRLTPLGEQLLSGLRSGYDQITTTLEVARATSQGIRGLLRVGFTVTTPSEPLTRLVEAFEARHPECQVTLHEHSMTEDDWDLWRPLRCGESDAMLYWQAVDGEPDLTCGPVIIWLDRVLLVARDHRLAARESVSAEELAHERVFQQPPSFPSAVMDAISPPVTPSGQPIPRTEPIRSFHELLSLVARGRCVHPTVTGDVQYQREDIAAVPIYDLPPMPLGLIWCTAHENARIRALAAAADAVEMSR
jgi:DNA-binding transcriptional LysR family regulator